MPGLENLSTRLNYRGGFKQQERLIEGKLRSLKKALLNSYQAATAILEDGREFRCLINPDKLKIDYEDKIISIPFEDICLNAKKVGKTSEGIQTVGMKVGDTFTWKENDTKWLVYMQMLEEKAYFRAEIRKCDYYIDINGKRYWFFLRRYDQSDALWHTSKNISWNELNYTLEMYITKDEFTEKHFKRFQIFEFGGQPWEVQDIDIYSTDGFVVVLLKEYYNNEIQDQILEEQKSEENNNTDISLPHINGNKIVYPYDENIEYTINNAEGGKWAVDSSKVEIASQDSNKVLINILTSKSGSFNLIYKRENENDIVLNVIIESL